MNNLLKIILNNYSVRFWVKEVNPLWSREGYKGKILDIKEESKDVKTFTMQVNNY